MKKLFLSLTVIVLFVFYSMMQRQSNTATNLIPPITFPSPTSFSNSNTSNSNTPIGKYKDGQFTGTTADAFYGPVQVKTIINGGKITDVQFLQYPNDRRNSIMINSQAMPILTQEAIQAQNSNVDIVSGATDTSQAFIQSLASALSQAQ